MTKKRKTKSKRKKKSSGQPRRTDLDIIKEMQSRLYTRARENIEIVLRQTGLKENELKQVIKKYGYDAIPTLDGFNISQPIWEQMVKIFKQYDKVSAQVDRYQVAHDKILVDDIEKKTQEMEKKAKQLEEENQFYSEKERDKEGMVKMKEKYFLELDHWKAKKAEAEEKLTNDPENQEALADKAEAENQLKFLKGKRWKVRFQNVQPGIAKQSNRVVKGVNTILDSVQEITKPFAEMGELSGYDSKGKSKKQYDYAQDWTPENIFGGSGKTKTKKEKKNYSWSSGF